MSDNELPRRRIPGLSVIFTAALVLLPLAVFAWWLNQPEAAPAAGGTPLAELDVVCLGRVDGLRAVAHLEPALPGRVGEVRDVEGKHLPAGAEILKLEDESHRLRVEEATAAITAAELEVEAAKQDQRLYPLRRTTQEASVAAATERVAAARRLLEEKKTGRSFGTVTAAEIIAAESEIKQLSQLEGVERSRLKEVDTANPSLKVRAAEARKVIADIALKQAEKAVRDCVLVAPTSGTVLRVLIAKGEAVAPGASQAPVVFRSDGPLVVRAELEQEYLGRVKAGMKATVTDDARVESPTWRGTVLSVGQVVARKRSVVFEPGELNDVRTVECVITLEGNTEGLLVGQRMRVRIDPDK